MGLTPRAPQLAIDTRARRLRPHEVPAAQDGAAEITWHGPAGFPPDHPWSEATIQAVSGVMAVNGRDHGAPRRLGLEAASVAAGILAAQGVLAAAVATRRGVPVPAVRTSVLQSGLLLLSHYFVVATGLGDAVPGPPLPAPGPPFRSVDGVWFEVETIDPVVWKAFWTTLGAAVADLGRGWTVFRWRYERAACSLPAGLHEATARYSLAELRRLAAETGMSLAPLRSYTDVLAEAAPAAGAGHPTVHLRPSDGASRRPAKPVAEALSGLPLAGIRVVEATSRIQGPFAGMLLRMLGADVVRVQPPEGDYGRAAMTLHRNKESVQIDLVREPGRAELLDLVADADVFLHNWRPGKAAAWHLELDDLARCQPALVYAGVSGWGDRPGTGHLLGTDFLVQADTGLGHGLHPEPEPPFPSRMILCDLFGALVAAEGVLAGLWRREIAGGACEVRSSLVAGAMALQAHVVDGIVAGKEEGRRDGRPVWGLLDRPVATADGALAVDVTDDEHFRRLCELCHVDPQGGTRDATDQRVAAELRRDTAVAWEDALVSAGLPAAVARGDLAEVVADARLAHLFEPVGDGALAPRSPWSFA